jgi:NADH dehydrogenase [ubiquinone] 1 alpha subcomplex assembly factor 7
VSALGREIEQRIALEGPITVERYMALCLAHPTLGYYMTRDPLGLDGDFITAPEISQMFGELIGLWAAQVWRDMGSPDRVRLIELGPGRGTLMADALRATRIVPGFHDAIQIDLVETSPILARKQQAVLAGSPAPASWHREVSEIGEGPAIVIANEFFDALPVRQFARVQGGWRERLVGLGDGGELAFGLAPEPTREIEIAGREGAVLEWPVAGLSIMRDLAHRLVAQGGAALVIDYGHLRSGLADTLQAVKNHAFTDALSEPGEADITAHVDFAQLAAAARSVGARIHGPTSQGAFLRALGIEARAATLARASPARADEFEAAKLRLTGNGEDEMGALFKVVGISAPGLQTLPGL